jgi:hypothetical protein
MMQSGLSFVQNAVARPCQPCLKHNNIRKSHLSRNDLFLTQLYRTASARFPQPAQRIQRIAIVGHVFHWRPRPWIVCWTRSARGPCNSGAPRQVGGGSRISFQFYGLPRHSALLLVGQGLLIRFMKTLPAHRTTTIKTMMRNPVRDGTPPLRCTHEAPETRSELWDASSASADAEIVQ